MSAIVASMFVLGLVTSLHCVSMCGPMVVSYALKGTPDDSWRAKLLPNAAYQGAKIVSYVFTGLVLGALGSAVNLKAVGPWVMFAAGAFMITLGLGMTGKFPWAARLTPRPPAFLMTALTKVRRKAVADAEKGESTIATPIVFGLLTGFFPCAPLQAAQLSAAATGSALTGGIAMLAFGLGTAPLMFAFGTASSLIPKQWKKRVMSVLAIVVILFGAMYLNRGLKLVGSPVSFDTVRQAVVGTSPSATSVPAGEYQTGADGVVEIPLAIQNTRFVPEVVSIPADTPVRLVVDRQEANACSDQLALPQLGILVDLAPNAVTTVDIPATAAGGYTLTCGMGMMSGRLDVGGAGGSGGRSPLLPIVLVVGAGTAVFALVRRRTPAQNAPATSSTSFTPAEKILVGAAIAFAVIAGLVLGGFFTGR